MVVFIVCLYVEILKCSFVLISSVGNKLKKFIFRETSAWNISKIPANLLEYICEKLFAFPLKCLFIHVCCIFHVKVGEWMVDFSTEGGVSNEGWQYASSFSGPFHPSQRARDTIRRRRWFRSRHFSVWLPCCFCWQLWSINENKSDGIHRSLCIL